MVTNSGSHVSAIIIVVVFLIVIVIRSGFTLRTTTSTTRLPSSPSTIDLSQANCRKSLGMQGGSIEDRSITASSSYDFGSVGPANARIRTEKNGGAWCPRQPITKDSYEWIQVDLVDLKVITQVETQGRFGSGQGQEFVEQYRLEFKRKNSGDWMRYKDKKYNEIFKGNNNTYIAELREINPPLVARKVRLVPLIPLSRTVCLRFELYGCAWRDGVVSYGMPQGDEFQDDLHLYDYTYDGPPGHSPSTVLWGGLGQLTDGAEGHSNFRLDPDGSGKKGYEWVGWKNETEQDEYDDDEDDNTDEEEKYLLRLSKVRPSGDLRHRRIQGKSDDPTGGKTGDEQGGGAGLLGRLRFKGSVRIVFEFDRLRNFSACRVHCNNMFSKEVRLFKRAALHFSSDGKNFKGSDVINFENTRDSLIEFARNVIIPIPGMLARVVVLELHHDSRWIMISEVRFESGIVVNNNNLNDDNGDDDDELTGSELRSGHLGSDKEVFHPPSNPSLHSSILSFNAAATAGDDDDDDEDDVHGDDDDDNNSNNDEGKTSLKNTSLDLGQSKQQHTSSFSTALLDRVVGVISGVIVALLFIIIFVIILYATKKHNNNSSSSHSHNDRSSGNNNVGNVAQLNDDDDDKNFQRLLCCRRRRRCCCCLCSCRRRFNMTEADGAKKASLDLSICDSTSWPPTMRKVVSNGNTYSNLSSNGCPGDGLPMTTDDVIWRADKFLLGGNNRKLPDLPGKLFLESSLMADTCDLISASSTYAIPELSRVDALKRKNSFCQSRSSPLLHPKTPPFSIFIPPPPPIQPTCRKLQNPKGLPDRDYDSGNQKGIHSLSHSGQGNRCADEDPSNISASDDDFYDLVTLKLRELDTPLLRQSDVILLQCLGNGEFGQLHLCELKRQTDEEATKETDTEAHRPENATPRHPNNNNNNNNNNKNDCSTSSSLSAGDAKSVVVDGSRESSAVHAAARNAAAAVVLCKDHPSLDGSEKKPQDSRRRWTVEKRKRFLVAVKSLNHDDEYSRRHFLSEMERSSGTRNENIAQLLGVSLIDDHGPALVYEFTKHGDLVQFLRGCVLADQLPQMGPEADTLSHGCLTHLGCQVASGMKYLEKCGLVHGDLSARNCLVGPRRLVKICDLARWRSSYRGDYYPPHPWSPPLPIRWMAWEAIHLNQVSSKSDVWSFGVTMWEILSLARLKPYHWLTDEQVLANLINRTHVTEVQQVESDEVTGSFSPQQHCWQQNHRFFNKQSQNIQLQKIRDFRTTLQQNSTSATTSETLSTKPTTHPTTNPTIKTTTRRNNSQLKTRPQPNQRPVYSTLQQAMSLGHEDTLVLLPQPIGCSKEIYDLLLECWTQDSGSRPSFADIHLFLMRYNDGHPNTPKNVASTIGTSRSAAGEAVAVEEHDV